MYSYISGENSVKGAIDMTAPVLTKITPGAGPNCNSTFVVSFYVPYAFQVRPLLPGGNAQTSNLMIQEAGPPAPTNPLVFIQTIGPLTVAVSTFGGVLVTEKKKNSGGQGTSLPLGFGDEKVVVAKAAELELAVEASPSLVADTSYGDSW